MSALPEPERRHAVEQARRLMIEEGYSQNRASDAVAEDLGVTGRTIKNWAVALGLPLGELSQEAAKARAGLARDTQETYDQLRRQGLSDLLFGKVKELAEKIEDAGDMKDLTTAFAILTDKRRLEEGKSTERHENIDPATALERGRARLNLLPRRA